VTTIVSKAIVCPAKERSDRVGPVARPLREDWTEVYTSFNVDPPQGVSRVAWRKARRRISLLFQLPVGRGVAGMFGHSAELWGPLLLELALNASMSQYSNESPVWHC